MHIIPNTDLLIAAQRVRPPATRARPHQSISDRPSRQGRSAPSGHLRAPPPWALAGAAALTDYLY